MNKKKQQNKQIVSPLLKIPPISNFPSRSLWEEAVWRSIILHIVTLQKPEEMQTFFEPILSSYERSNIIQRIAAIDRITEGHSYRTIGKELWLTNQTISSIKKAWGEKHYRSYHERGKTERKKKVYSPPSKSSKSHKDPFRKTRRTKFGTIKGW